MTEFVPFPKIPRLMRKIVVTEKLDGTNASVMIRPIGSDGEQPGAVATLRDETISPVMEYQIFAGSRSRWLQPGKTTDNFGFASWVYKNLAELFKLGPGHHFGEWWGLGIQRGYDLHERRFSLFNTGRWVGWNTEFDSTVRPVLPGQEVAPTCCGVVPVLYEGPFDLMEIDMAMSKLATTGSVAAPGFAKPEGIVVYHEAARQLFKYTLEDDAHKG